MGYTTIEMQAGKWYQIGTPFVALEDGQTATLNTAFGQGFANGDLIYIYNPETNGYDGPYMWLSGDGQTGWRSTTNPSALCSVSLNPGQAVFIQKNTTGDIPIAGRVTETTPSVFGAKETSSWAQVACVYPETLALNEMKWTNLANGDLAYVYNSETNGYDGPYMWLSGDGQTGWRSTTNPSVLCSVSLKPGQAVFIQKNSVGEASLLPLATHE